MIRSIKVKWLLRSILKSGMGAEIQASTSTSDTSDIDAVIKSCFQRDITSDKNNNRMTFAD